jgi:ribosomal protein S18 acetylase RimI-like enzyme
MIEVLTLHEYPNENLTGIYRIEDIETNLGWLYALDQAIFPPNLSTQNTEGQYQNAVQFTESDLLKSLANSEVCVYFESGKPIAYLSYTHTNLKGQPPIIELINIGVVPEHRGKGLSTQLMQLLFEHNSNCKEFELVTHESNKAAQGLYGKSGFVKATSEQIEEYKKRTGRDPATYFGPQHPRILFKKLV